MMQTGCISLLIFAAVIAYSQAGEYCREKGVDQSYTGTRHFTKSRIKCQRWDAQEPHKHDKMDTTKYPDAVNNKDNLCRNPTNASTGPWCYTTDPNVRQESCGVPFCNDCILTKKGLEYRGTQQLTISGEKCQDWDKDTPHKHTRNDVTKFPEAEFNEANYCRNPGQRNSGPYCFTRNPAVRWETCGLPLCKKTFV